MAIERADKERGIANRVISRGIDKYSRLARGGNILSADAVRGTVAIICLCIFYRNRGGGFRVLIVLLAGMVERKIYMSFGAA